MKKTAFTMLELVFVIVVLGILAAAIIPRMDRDTVYEASEQLLNHIKYTQQLAMSDNVYNDSDEFWYRNRWGISIDGNTYSIIRRNSSGTAVDPLTKAAINGTNDYDLADKYTATISAPSDPYILAFDHLGRPYDYSAAVPTSAVENLLDDNLTITITASGETATITVVPETGYSVITY